MSNSLTFKLHYIFLENFREVAVRPENNACQISWQSDENCVSHHSEKLDGAPVWHFISRRGAGCFYRAQKFKQNGRRLYCSYQLDSNFHLFIFSWCDLKKLFTMAAKQFFSVTNWLYATRQSDEGVQTSHWCLACFFNRQLVNRASPVDGTGWQCRLAKSMQRKSDKFKAA